MVSTYKYNQVYNTTQYNTKHYNTLMCTEHGFLYGTKWCTVHDLCTVHNRRTTQNNVQQMIFVYHNVVYEIICKIK